MTLMPSQPDPAFDPGAIRLSGHGTTVTAVALRTQLVDAADTADATVIDASDMLSVGQAVLQLLIAARNDATAQAHPFSYAGASPAFSDRVASCQLADAIGLEIAKDNSL